VNILSKQIMRSGTAIGALVSEACFAQSKADFISKMRLALKKQMKPDTGLNYYLRLRSLQQKCIKASLMK